MVRNLTLSLEDVYSTCSQLSWHNRTAYYKAGEMRKQMIRSKGLVTFLFDPSSSKERAKTANTVLSNVCTNVFYTHTHTLNAHHFTMN